MQSITLLSTIVFVFLLMHSANGNDDDVEFAQANNGNKATYPVRVTVLRRNGYIMLHGRPCKIIESESSGNAINIVGIDIFTQKQYEGSFGSNEYVDIPNVTRQEYTLIDITNDGKVAIMAENTETREDLNLPDGELGDKIKEKFEKANGLVLITVMAAINEEAIVSVKTP